MATAKEKLIAGAQKLVDKGAFEKAIKEYLRVVQEDDSDVRIWLKIGDLYKQIGKKTEATETYQRVAQFYSDQGFYLKSVAVYKQILKLDPRLVDVNQRLAELYKQLGLISDAISQYEQVAGFYHKEGKVREALASMKQIVDLDPETVAARIKLAEMYSRENMPREAIDEFTKAAEQLKEQGRTDEYMKVAERLLFHAPDNRPVTKELARLYIEKNDPRRALPKLQVLFKADPRDLDVLRLLARAFEGLEQRPKAVSVYKELARILTETGDQRGAAEVFQQILLIEPDDADAGAAARGKKGSGLSRGPVAPSTPPRVLTTSNVPLRAHATGAEQALDSGGHRAMAPMRESTTARPGSVAEIDRASSGEDVVQEEIAKILSETDVYIKYNLHTKAIEHLQRVFERAPRHTAAREKLKALYITIGKKDDAILELWALAEQAEQGRARRYIREIYELDPHNARAAQILNEPIGGSPRPPALEEEPVDDFGVAPPSGFGLRKADPPTRRGRVIEEESEASIDIEAEDALSVDDDLEEIDDNALETIGEEQISVAAEVDDDDLIPVIVDSGPIRVADVAEDEDADRFSLDAADDEPTVDPAPAAAKIAGRVSSPSFATAGPDAETRFGGLPTGIGFDAVEEGTGTGTRQMALDELSSFDDPAFPSTPFADAHTAQHTPDLDSILDEDLPSAEAMPTPQTSGARRAAHVPEPIRADSTLEDDLDETEFFMQQSLFDEARDMLASLNERYPEHPLVAAKKRELEALEQSATPPVEEAPFEVSHASVVSAQLPVDLPGEVQSVQRATPSGEPVEVTRRGVIDRGVSAEDFETHYDLGIAYKEMGLIDDAIVEFRQVMKLSSKEVQCHLMIGLCYVEKQAFTEAINQFKKGLYVEGITDPEALSMYYELGQAYERVGDPREALYYYDKVQKRDPKFRDLSRRLRALRGEEPEVETATATRTDDVDNAFDSLLDEG